MHQITAYAGLKGHAPFQRAIAQSPGWQPIISANQQEGTFNDFLSAAGVKSLDDLRKAPTETLISANKEVIATPSDSASIFGISVDGYFVPANAPQLLAQGKFDKNVDVMVSHNTHEGLLFTPLIINTESKALSFFRSLLPNFKEDVLDFVTSTLYPPTFDGSFGYSSEYERAALIISDVAFVCNTNYLGRAYGGKTFSYRFAVPPGLHGQDIGFTFAGGKVPAGILGPNSPEQFKVAAALQDYIVTFTIDGRPRARNGAPAFPRYGSDAKVVVLDPAGIKLGTDDAASARCAWWQKGLYA